MEREVSLLLITLAVSFLYYLGSLWRRRQGSGRLPPGPRPLPVIGNALDMRGNLHHKLAHLARTYGPIMHLQLGPVPAVVLSSRDATREAFTKHDRRLSGRYAMDAVSALGWADRSMIYLPSSDPLWRLQRGIVNAHLLSPRSLDVARAVRERKVRDLVDHFRARAGREVEVGRALYGCMINLVSSVLFSVDGVVDLDAATVSTHGIREHVEGIADLMLKPNVSDLFPFLRVLDLQGRRREAARHVGAIYHILDGIIDRRLAEAAASPSGDKQSDFLQVLLDLMSTGEMDRSIVKAIVFDVFMAGSEPSTVAVEWAMAELLHHPSIMAKVRAEIDTVVGNKKIIEEPDVAGLPYLKAVLKEAMRLHPPAPLMVPRKAIEDGVEIGGYAVPKGCMVFINVWTIMRDPAVWEKPEEFMPERFLDTAAVDPVDFKGKDYEFLPFGTGRRQCPGLPLVECLMPHLLASLLHAFEWRLPEGMSTEQLDVSERFSTTNVLAVPLKAVPIAVIKL